MSLDIVAWHDRTGADHTAQLNTYAKQGYRTLSLSVYDNPAHPLYAAVMIKRATLIAEQQLIGLSGSAFQTEFNQMAAKGWGPTIISATGPANSASFSVCFSPMASIPLTRSSLSAHDFATLNQQQMAAGNILTWMDTYGDAQNLVYIGIWGANSDQRAWNCDALNDNMSMSQERFNAITSGFGRLVHPGMTQADGTMALYDDSMMGGWETHSNLTSAQYQTEFNQQTAKGLYPVRVSAKGSGANARFAAVFMTAEHSAPRTPVRMSDLSGMGIAAVSAIDNAMVAVMTANMLHGAAVALTVGTKLVYTRGYTMAEPGYPDVQPTTLFRQASVSKTFTAAALYELIDEKVKLANGNTFGLSTLLLDVLPDIANGPTQANWNKITIQHLLEMTSGVTTSILGTDAQVSSTLPVSSKQMAQWLYKLPLGNTPGDAHQGNYSNAGYMILGMVVAKLRGKSNLADAVTASVCAKLHITRLRSAQSIAANAAADEARYHPRPLVTAKSVMVTGQPLCALGYGDWNLPMTDGAGGLSIAVTDVARLVAALSVTDANPLMSLAMLQQWMANAAHASSTISGPSAHGYHGFDGVSVTDAAKHLYSGNKGGSLDTSQNSIYFETGGVGLVMCWNGTTPTGPSWYPAYQPIVDAARSHDWGSTDLFPHFGMPSFLQTLVLPKPLPIPKQTITIPSHMNAGTIMRKNM
ncbi:MAG TPA: serine hydrolase [Acidobacteriaceae bacterium]